MDKEDLEKLFDKVTKGAIPIKVDKFSKIALTLTPMILQPTTLIETMKRTDPELAEEIMIMYIGTLLLANTANVDEAISILKKTYRTFTDVDKTINED
jgi:hypothetical protein